MMNKSVLIVEDNAIVAVHLCNMLIELDYSVVDPIATGELAIITAVDAPPHLMTNKIKPVKRQDYDQPR